MNPKEAAQQLYATLKKKEEGYEADAVALINTCPAVVKICPNNESLLLLALDTSEAVSLKCLEHGANVHVVDMTGWTPFMYAAQSGFVQVIHKLFLLTPLQINHVNHRGETALHIAAAEGCLATVNALLAHGIHISQLDHHGRSAEQNAILCSGIHKQKGQEYKALNSMNIARAIAKAAMELELRYIAQSKDLLVSYNALAPLARENENLKAIIMRQSTEIAAYRCLELQHNSPQGAPVRFIRPPHPPAAAAGQKAQPATRKRKPDETEKHSLS